MAVLNKGEILYSSGEIIDKLYFLEHGSVEIKIFDQIKIIEKGFLGEWSLIDMPSLETVKILDNKSKILIIKPDDLLKMKDVSKILFEIFKSVSQKLFFIDEKVLSSIDIKKARESFSKKYKGFHDFDSDYSLHFLRMKNYFNEDNYSDALNELNLINVEILSQDINEEINLWRSILKFKMNINSIKNYLAFFDEKKSANHLSYHYLKSLVNNKKDGFYDLFAKHGLRIPEKTVLIKEGDPTQGKGFYLLNGALKVGRFSSENNYIISFIKNGEVFGESAFFKDSTRQATVFNDNPCDIIIFDNDSLMNSFHSSPLFGLTLIKNQLNRIVSVMSLIEIMNILDDTKRVMTLIKKYIFDFKKAGFSVNEISIMSNSSFDVVLNVLNQLEIKITANGYLK